MVDKKISALPAASATTGAEIIPIVQAGNTVRTTIDGLIPKGTYAKTIQVLKYAVGDGVTDDTAAINAAIAAAAATLKSGNYLQYGDTSGFYTGSTVAVDFGSAVYKISGQLPMQQFIHVVGDKAVIKAPPTVDVFTNVGYENSFEGITIRGGRNHISLVSGNADMTVIPVEKCDFIDPSGAAMYSDDTSPSTIFLVNKCRLIINQVGAKACDVSIDSMVFQNCWVTSRALATFEVRNGRLRIQGGFNIPLNPDGAWIKLGATGGVKVTNSHFGGENGTKMIVESWAEANTVSPHRAIQFHYCTMHTSSKPSIKLYALPNKVDITACEGFHQSTGIYLDPGITATQRDNFAKYGHFRIDGNEFTLSEINGLNDPTSAGFVSIQSLRSERSILQISDRVAEAQVNSPGISLTSASITGSQPINIFGNVSRRAVATAADAFMSVEHSTLLNGLPTGTYTFSVVVWAENHPTTVILTAGSKKRRIHIPVGLHVMCMPFHYVSGESPTTVVAYVSNMMVGTTVETSNFRIFKGAVQINANNTIAYGAVPTTGTWRRGDQALTIQPAAGGSMGSVCTTAGTPGTWKTFGAVSA